MAIELTPYLADDVSSPRPTDRWYDGAGLFLPADYLRAAPRALELIHAQPRSTGTGGIVRPCSSSPLPYIFQHFQQVVINFFCAARRLENDGGDDTAIEGTQYALRPDLQHKF